MAPVRRPNSRVEAIEKIRDMMQLNAPSEAMIEATEIWKEACDPYNKFVMDQYLKMEKQRIQFLKMVGPLFEDVNADILDNPTSEDRTMHANRPMGSIKNLSFELVASKFLMPIAKAAQELNVSETTLTLWRSISGISYWPYRKLSSIDMLINNIQKFGSDKRLGDEEVQGTIEMLKEEKKVIMNEPSLALKDTTRAMIKKMHRLASIKRKKSRKEENSSPGILMASEVDPSNHVRNNYIIRDKMKGLSFELVASKFRMPIERAAEELWETGRDVLIGKQSTVVILQKLAEERKAIETNPSLAMQASTSSLMKYTSKVIMKKRRLMNVKENA